MKTFAKLLASGMLVASIAGCTDNLTSFLSGTSTSGVLDSLVRHGLRVDSTRHDGDSTRHDGGRDSTGRGRGESPDSTEVHNGGHGADSTGTRHDGGVSDSLRGGNHDGGLSDTTRHDGRGSDTTRHDGRDGGRGSDTTRHDGGSGRGGHH